MNKTERLYLHDMLDYAYKLSNLASRMSRTDFDTDEALRAACRYWFQVIGEAATHISSSFQDAHPEVEWRLMIGMRNRIAHDYLGIDDDIIWDTLHDDDGVPSLIVQLEQILPSEGTD